MKSPEEIRSFFSPEADYEFPELSCRAAIVLLDWSVVASFLAAKKVARVENVELRSNYFGHFCILLDIKGEEAFLIDPSEKGLEKPWDFQHPVQGGRLRKLPLRVFEVARKSPGTDEDVVLVSWSPKPDISHLRKKPSWQLPDAFLSACYQGKTKMVLDHLKSTDVAAAEAPNHRRNLRTTPLIVASWRGHPDVARVLLERRATPNEVQPATALWFAAEAGHMEAWRLSLFRCLTLWQSHVTCYVAPSFF